MSGDAREAKILTVALSQEPSVVERVEAQAADRVRQLLTTYGDAIAMLSDDRRALYGEVRAMAREPEVMNPLLPSGPITMPGDTTVPGYERHLYSNAEGVFRARLLTWEQHVLAVESGRPGFVAWYRNPTGGQRSVRVPYRTGSGWGKLYPDFIVLHRDGEDRLQASIVDPHGHHLADSGDKLRGLAKYSEDHGAAYGRILSVIKMADGGFRMVDLKDPTIRAALQDVNGQEAIEAVFAEHGASY